jgi:hypothetical protein
MRLHTALRRCRQGNLFSQLSCGTPQDLLQSVDLPSVRNGAHSADPCRAPYTPFASMMLDLVVVNARRSPCVRSPPGTHHKPCAPWKFRHRLRAACRHVQARVPESVLKVTPLITRGSCSL